MRFFNGLIVCWLVVFNLSAEVKNDRPNIVLIMADDVSSKVRAFGDELALTPNIDALAQQGVRYNQFYTVAGVCSPSRAAHITGTYPISIGAMHMRTADKKYDAVPPADVKAYPELLRQAGYATANVAKKDYQFGEPFTIWDVEVGGFIGDPDLAVWRKLPKEKPFFAMVTLLSTHESRLAPRNLTPEDASLSGLLPMMSKWVNSNVDKVTKSQDVIVPPYLPNTPKVRDSIAQQYDLIHYMDNQVGQLIQNLKDDGLYDNTIILWTTDNGDGFPRAKRAVLDSGIHLPMILKLPNDKKKGSLDTRLVSMVDVAPTILTLAGVDVPNYMQGQDFLNAPKRQYVYAARDRMTTVDDRVRAVRDARYKLIKNYVPNEPYFRPLPFRDMFPIMKELNMGYLQNTLSPLQRSYFTSPRDEIELYDTLNDPDEIHNLAADANFSSVKQRLLQALDKHLKNVGDKAQVAENAMINEMWSEQLQPATLRPSASIAKVDNSYLVTLSSNTEGASIGYQIFSVDKQQQASDPWLLYNGPLKMTPDEKIVAKAIRYGFGESQLLIVDPAL